MPTTTPSSTPTTCSRDDERQFSALTQEYLEAKGYIVTLRHSGDEGLAAFKAGLFDCFVLDVRMPLKDGFSLARDIREIERDVPLVFLSRLRRRMIVVS